MGSSINLLICLIKLLVTLAFKCKQAVSKVLNTMYLRC